MSPLDFAAASLVVFVGAVVQGGIGFGLALIAAPFLMLFDPALVPGPILVTGLAATSLEVLRERGSIEVSGVCFCLSGRVLGMLPAVLLLPALSRAGFDLLFGALIIAAVALSVSGRSVAVTRPNQVLAGAMSGFSGTISAVGGPPMGLLYQHASGPVVRGTLGAFRLVGVVVSLCGLALVGEFTRPDFWAGLSLVPAAILGTLGSGLVVRHVDRRGVRPYILGLSLAAALAVVGRGLLSS